MPLKAWKERELGTRYAAVNQQSIKPPRKSRMINVEPIARVLKTPLEVATRFLLILTLPTTILNRRKAHRGRYEIEEYRSIWSGGIKAELVV